MDEGDQGRLPPHPVLLPGSVCGHIIEKSTARRPPVSQGGIVQGSASFEVKLALVARRILITDQQMTNVVENGKQHEMWL